MNREVYEEMGRSDLGEFWRQWASSERRAADEIALPVTARKTSKGVEIRPTRSAGEDE